jgi:hypothetical protein
LVWPLLWCRCSLLVVVAEHRAGEWVAPAWQAGRSRPVALPAVSPARLGDVCSCCPCTSCESAVNLVLFLHTANLALLTAMSHGP